MDSIQKLPLTNASPWMLDVATSLVTSQSNSVQKMSLTKMTKVEVVKQYSPCKNSNRYEHGVSSDRKKTPTRKQNTSVMSINVQQPSSIRNNSTATVADPIQEENRADAKDRIVLEKELDQQIPGQAPRISRETGLEEDYENDETCVITETDLGEISAYEKDLNQVETRQSTISEKDIKRSPSVSITGEHGVNYILQSAADLRRDRHQFCKQMLIHDDDDGAHRNTREPEVMYEPLESPSQVLKLIQRFQQQINDNTGGNTSIHLTSVEDKNLPPKMQSSPELFKDTANPNTNEPSDGCHRKTSIPKQHKIIEPVDVCHGGQVSSEASPDHVELPMAKESIKVEVADATNDKSCDQETIEAIEQLDKSIDEVIIYDNELATKVQYENRRDLQTELDNRKLSTTANVAFSMVNASSQTNMDSDDKDHVVNKDTSSTGHKRLPVDDIQPVVSRVTDASVNTDFDTAEYNELANGNGYPEEATLAQVDYTSTTKHSKLSTSGHARNSSINQTNGDSDSSDQDKFTVMSTKPEVPSGNTTPVKRPLLKSSPKPLTPVNGHTNESVAHDQEDNVIGDGKTWAGDAKSCRRMSTATLDGAVVAHSSADCIDSSSLHGHHGHFVVVAIDFGTTYSGYAFSFINDPENIHIMRKWEGGDPGVINQKTLTTLLLTPEKQFHSVGFTARDHYHDLDPDEAKRWLYFDKFKMTLHHNTNLTKETEIQAANGKKMPAVTVFSHVLRYFKAHSLQELSDQSATRIVNEDIRWVITVPAIWRQPAKQFMREAAYEAGIASLEYPDQLLIALEPEAASIYCRSLRIHQLASEVPQQYFGSQSKTSITKTNSAISKYSPEEMTPGTRYIVVDCGGGTVDITVHELMDQKGNLQELHKPTGGPCGSVMVDSEFENLLADIFGVDFMRQFKLQRPASFVDLMMAFEARKRNTSPFRNNPSNVSLPFSFVDFYKKCKGGTIEAAIKRYGRKDIRWSSQGMLRLEPTAMQQLFTKAIENIKRHVSHVLAATNNTIKYLFLVGGFAESQLLQQAIRNTFDKKVRVIIPQEVSLAILKGAVLYGREPTAVSVRRSKMTYGVGVLNRYMPGIHPPNKRIIKDGIEWCTDVFDRFVSADQSVELGDVVLRSYTPARYGQTNIVLHVYCSEKDDVSFITDEGVSRCGTLHLDLSDVRYISVPKRREIQTRMIFGDTELKISALDVTTGKCVRAQFNFFNH